MVWCLHYIYVDMFIINVPPTLKRSMYDYKLYVSLLIFVYSLMDSDERASLQKKMVKPNTINENTNNTFVYISWNSFDLTHNACYIMWSKKKWNEINECFRATFVYQAHEVGGREAHKIVGVELLFYPPNFVFPPRPTPQFCGGDSPRFGSTTMVGCPPKGTSMDVLQQMKLEHKIMFNWTPRSASRQKDVSHQTRRHVNKRNSVMSVMLKKKMCHFDLAISRRRTYEKIFLIWIYDVWFDVCIIYMLICLL